MNLENTITECDLDPAARKFADELRRQGRKPESDMAVDGFTESLGERVMRLFRRERG